METGSEWAQNKKVVDLSTKDVRSAVSLDFFLSFFLFCEAKSICSLSIPRKQFSLYLQVPKGFPFFSVDFGLQGGFAHVVEDEKNFPGYFGRVCVIYKCEFNFLRKRKKTSAAFSHFSLDFQEICGGMLELGPELWRKPHKENFETQREKVLKFARMWKPFDWTHKIQRMEEESD